MKIADVRRSAFAMPLTRPTYPPGPYRFVNREYLIISYRTTREALERVVPAPLEIGDPIVKYEFIRMPDSTGFGDFTESGQVIPVSYKGKHGGYVHAMYLNDHPPIAGGRELWGFPKYLAEINTAFRPSNVEVVLGPEIVLSQCRRFGCSIKSPPFITYSILEGRVIRTVVECGH